MCVCVCVRVYIRVHTVYHSINTCSVQSCLIMVLISTCMCNDVRYSYVVVAMHVQLCFRGLCYGTLFVDKFINDVL